LNPLTAGATLLHQQLRGKNCRNFSAANER
jgi:hypothetical protein